MTTTEPRTDRFTGVAICRDSDMRSVNRLLRARPIDNLFVAARIRHGGLDPLTLGCEVWGYWEDGELVSLLHAGANYVPINATCAALDAFVEHAGPHRRCSSIIGPSHIAMDLWQRMCRRWGKSWRDARDVRPHQPVMVIDDEPVIESDLRVRQIHIADLQLYLDAAISMYTEEVGVSPVRGNSSPYRLYMRQIIEAGRAFGWVDQGRVRFKSDLGSVSGRMCQVQGVWLEPRLRGRGLAAAMMAQVVRLARVNYPVVTLYVNDFNTPAIATYRSVGFSQAGEFATVLF